MIVTMPAAWRRALIYPWMVRMTDSFISKIKTPPEEDSWIDNLNAQTGESLWE